MKKSTIIGAMLAGAIAAPLMAQPAGVDFDARPEVSTTQKGSLLYWLNVELKWAYNTEQQSAQLVQDTFIELTNDADANVDVQLYLCNGDEETNAVIQGSFPFEVTERAHTGWNCVDAQIPLTRHKPTYWSAATGNNNGGDVITVQPFGSLDPDCNPHCSGPGRPDPDGTGLRAMRGFVVGWAVDTAGNEICHNDLTGSAMIVDYYAYASWEYNAFAYRCIDANGDGTLALDSTEYDSSPGRLQLDFYSVSTDIFSANQGQGPVPPWVCVADTDLTTMPASLDLRHGGEPETTKLIVDIWNQNEIRLSGTKRCVTCWDSTLLRNFQSLAGNNFVRPNIQTDKGKARITGKDDETDTACDGGIGIDDSNAVLGVAVKILYYGSDPTQDELCPVYGGPISYAGSSLHLHGTDNRSSISWNVIDPGTELREKEEARIKAATKKASRTSIRGTRN